MDEMVVEMKFVTSARGTLTLSATSELELFKLVKCGIGVFGVVMEFMIKCVDVYKLVENMWMVILGEIEKNYEKWLREY